MDTVEIRLIFQLSIFWIKADTMATSQLMTGKRIPHFGRNSLISTRSFGVIFILCHIVEMMLPSILDR